MSPAPPTPAPEFIGARAAAARLSISLPALYAAVRKGDLPAYRLGQKRLRFRIAELDAALRREQPKAAPVVP